MQMFSVFFVHRKIVVFNMNDVIKFKENAIHELKLNIHGARECIFQFEFSLCRFSNIFIVYFQFFVHTKEKMHFDFKLIS